jgi:hypothetical protein
MADNRASETALGLSCESCRPATLIAQMPLGFRANDPAVAACSRRLVTGLGGVSAWPFP